LVPKGRIRNRGRRLYEGGAVRYEKTDFEKSASFEERHVSSEFRRREEKEGEPGAAKKKERISGPNTRKKAQASRLMISESISGAPHTRKDLGGGGPIFRIPEAQVAQAEVVGVPAEKGRHCPSRDTRER